MNIPYILAILFYELLDLLPNLFLAFVPFQNYMRFSKKHTAFIILLLYIMLSCSRMIALNNLFIATALTALWILFYLFFYLSCIRCSITKLLFVLLNLLNYGSFVVVLFSYFAYHRFPAATDRPYTLLSSMILALVYLFSYPIMYLLMEKKIRPLIESSDNNRIWRLLWLVPATFCLAYYYNLYSNGGIIAYSAKLSNVLFAVFFNLGAIFVTFQVIHLLNECSTNLKLKMENYQLGMQCKQYENLKDRVEDARRARHDLRQNLAVIQSYLLHSDTDGLMQYLLQYISALPPDTPITYCDDYALNALIVYYESIAREHNVSFTVDAQYPSDSCITDADATVLFGNLIENAVDACIRQTGGESFISLHIKAHNRMLVVTLDNTYSGNIYKIGDNFRSSKSERIGIGISSIQKIAEKYNGMAVFDFDGSQFHTSVMLNLCMQV